MLAGGLDGAGLQSQQAAQHLEVGLLTQQRRQACEGPQLKELPKGRTGQIRRARTENRTGQHHVADPKRQGRTHWHELSW